MSLAVLSPPAEEALSLASAKAYLRIGHEGENDLISSLVEAARARLEQASGLVLVSRTFRQTLTSWPLQTGNYAIRLVRAPVASLLAVNLYDDAGVGIDHTGRFQLEGNRLCLRPWSIVPSIPIGGRVEIDYAAGFGAAADIPSDLVQALQWLLADAYAESGRSVSNDRKEPIPTNVQAIIDAHREVRL